MSWTISRRFAAPLTALALIAPLHQAAAQAPSYLGWTRDVVNYLMFLPDNDHFTWAGQSMAAWNRLVGANPGGPFDRNDWLIGYRIDGAGNPIRNHLPSPDDGDHELGVLTSAQMVNRGYNSWSDLGANGVNYQWTQNSGGLASVIVENDSFINPAIADDADQHRKSLTHEFGHALGLSHDTFHFGLMYPGTFRQPPNYASWWYNRMYDMHRERFLLEQINDALEQRVWTIENFADMAVWSQTHDNWGSSGSLVVTDVAPATVPAGGTLTLDHLQVENRGNLAAGNVRVTAYLSTNPTISSSDREIGSFSWGSFPGPAAWRNGSVTMRVPAGTPSGAYFVGLVLNTSASEISTANNTAILTGDHTTGFDPIRVTVTN